MPQGPQPLQSTARAVRVVIVDDQPHFRQAARDLLEWRGYCVVGEAGDAASALDTINRVRPDAVLLDIRLGDDDGFAVARALTAVTPAAAVVLISSDDYRHDGARVRESGARGFVRKSHLAHTDLARFWAG